MNLNVKRRNQYWTKDHGGWRREARPSGCRQALECASPLARFISSRGSSKSLTTAARRVGSLLTLGLSLLKLLYVFGRVFLEVFDTVFTAELDLPSLVDVNDWLAHLA